MGNRLIVPGDGPPCPTCLRPTQIREHRQITADLLAKPYYFRRWFCCVNRRCKTKLIMRDEFKVVATRKRPGKVAPIGRSDAFFRLTKRGKRSSDRRKKDHA